MDLLERSEERWIEQYLHGKRSPRSREMDFGSKMADALESGNMSGDIGLDIVMEKLPKYEIMDQEIGVDLMRGRGTNPIPLLAKPDTRNADFSAFREYKTGRNPWTQGKVDVWGQITFYAVVGYIVRGSKLVDDIHLDWVPTELGPGGLVRVTGELKSFKTTRTMADILRMMLRMRRAWGRIETLTERELF